MVQLKETLHRLMSPEIIERTKAKIFVNRYESIKPELILLGAELQGIGMQDKDEKWITSYTLSCSKARSMDVQSLLSRAHIKDLTDSPDKPGEMTTAGLFALVGSGESYETNQKRLNTVTFIIYRGKYMSQNDARRLHAMPEEVK
jgi:hypothetical protein